ncbi:MAG TPA: hypothetical protein VFJ16_22850 [Longimicrobium sp.]|nr:hypothetical protein [Longimicrobium sp.]
MPIFSFHLAKATIATAATALLRPPATNRVTGLRRVECMMVMVLGSSIVSSARFQSRKLAVFASWDNEQAIDRFLIDHPLGRTLATGWHVRMEFLRRWGRVSGFDDLPANVGHEDAAAPVVAVTLARLKLPEVPRFIRWGKPVEEFVRDHPATTLALAAMRPPRTVSTFSVWRSLGEMTDMVRGLDSVPGAHRHAAAMVERNRRDFHHQFTTLRFRPLSEHGSWGGRADIVPRSIPA